jgi:hypothetical protein
MSPRLHRPLRPRLSATRLVLTFAACAFGLACALKADGMPAPGGGPTFATPPGTGTPAAHPVGAGGLAYGRLARFSSPGEFDAYVKRVREAWEKRQRSRGRGRRGLGGIATKSAAPAAAESAAPSDGDRAGGDESITNNQEAGVDEGDIVKAAGEYFVILRRGRLFSVRQSARGEPTLVPTGRCDAYPPGGSQGTWYDEMLIHGNRIVVIGFSYRVGGTEIGLFTLHRDGRITHDATHFLRSNDYYSSRNYASRLVGGRLVFYMPYMLGTQGTVSLPGVATWQARTRAATPWHEILAKMDVYRPVQPTLMPTLHTVVQCDLGSADFACTARAVIGPFSRTFYVARDAVYLWVAPGWWESQATAPGAPAPHDAYVYRLPIQSDRVTALRARGTPIDQFSFKEGRDGYLNVLVTDRGGGDWMFGPEHARGRMALLRAPLAAFGPDAPAASAAAYTRLPRSPGGYSLQNRFVGDYLLWGSGNGWWGGGPRGGNVFVTDVRNPADVSVLPLPHGVDRIEALGRNAVVVGSAGRDLHFTSVALGPSPVVRGSHVRAGAAQGETRSHGCFFLPDRQGGGLLGLPVRTQGRPGDHLVHGSAEVLFLRVAAGLTFQPLGALAASAAGSVRDACVVSCVDWYGNARPIFYRGRVFALLGYELVEGRLAGQGLREAHRVQFLRPQVARLAR